MNVQLKLTTTMYLPGGILRMILTHGKGEANNTAQKDTGSLHQNDRRPIYFHTLFKMYDSLSFLFLATSTSQLL